MDDIHMRANGKIVFIMVLEQKSSVMETSMKAITKMERKTGWEKCIIRR
jgi:hypothetical protein